MSGAQAFTRAAGSQTKKTRRLAAEDFVDDKETDGEIELVTPCLLDVHSMYYKNSKRLDSQYNVEYSIKNMIGQEPL